MEKKDEKEVKDIEYFFNEVALYKKEKFKIFKKDQGTNIAVVDEEEYIKFFIYSGIRLLQSNRKIIAKCKECDRELSFDFEVEIKNTSYMSGSHVLYLDEKSILKVKSGEIFNKNILFENLPKYQSFDLEYLFSCSHRPEHKYNMNVKVELKKDTFIVTKYGSYPSILDIKGFEFSKYSKFLNTIDAENDFKQSELSYAQNFTVGAYAYLRRVFEKMVNYYLDNLEEKKEYTNMDEKLKAIRDRFEGKIRDQRTNIYSIVSLGIHELSEEECKVYYEFLKGIICIQLRYEKSLEEMDKESIHYASSISNIATRLSERMKNK